MTGKWTLIGLSALAALMLQTQPAPAQQKIPAVSAGVSAGLMFAADEQFREFYGSHRIVVGGQADFRAYRRFLVFVGYDHGSRTGSAVGSNDPLQFRMHTMKFGGLIALPLRSLLIRAGAGIGLHNYKETWAAADVVTSGTRPGFILQAGAERPLAGRIALGGKIEYSSVSEKEISLGGLAFAAGLTIRLK
jgi:hypothetical protein